jgi:4,5-DOPA dioxygenase extradiol
MKARLESGDRAALPDYREAAPFAVRNHPTDEHLLPLFVAMGAAGPEAKATQLHSSFEHGILAMDAYAFQ